MKPEPLQPDPLTLQIMAALDDTLGPEELAALAGEIGRSATAQNQYVEIMAVHALLRQSRGFMAGLLTADDAHWAALSASVFRDTVDRDLQNQAMRQTLESQEPPAPEKPSGYRRRRPGPADIRRMARRSAAIVLLCLGVLWFDQWLTTGTPGARETVELARLTESRQARWGNLSTAPGDNRILYNRGYHLLEGWAAIRLNDGAELLLQAPVALDLENSNQIYLRHGCLTARIPVKAQGFTVRSALYSIVDYGTEFGVQVSNQSGIETHVFRGEVEMRTGANPLVFDQSQRLTAGTAGLAGPDGIITVADAARRPRLFLQELPAADTLALPGRRLDLADMIGGGNGLGTGRANWAIDPLTGQSGPKPNYFSPDTIDPATGKMATGKGRVAETRFRPVIDNPLIDCVAIPLGSGPVPVSTAGHLFEECPPCSGNYYQQITNSNPLNKPLTMGGIDYGTARNPGFYMHASSGLTFDLAAIRQTLTGVEPYQFQTLFGRDDHEPVDEESNGSAITLVVLVDGQVRFWQTYRQKGAYPVTVPLESADRFLTLFVHDGGDGTGGDRCVLGKPALSLRPEL